MKFEARTYAIALLCVCELSVVSRHRDGFKVEWQNGTDVAASVLQLFEVRPVPAAYDEHSHWSFASVTNTATHSSAYDDEFARGWPDLIGETIYAPDNVAGAIQLGKSGSPGRLQITNVSASAEQILIRSQVRNANSGRRMRVECLGGDGKATTNVVDMTEEFSDYLVDLAGATNVVMYPTSQKALVQISDIRLISSYHPAYIGTNAVAFANAGLRGRWTFAGLLPGDYLCRLETRFVDGSPPEISPYSAITLSPDDPPLPVGFAIHVR